MPSVPSLKPREVIKKFQKAGFVIDRQRGSHVILYHPIKHTRLVVPMHIKDMPRGTLLAIIKQSGLSKENFLKL